jgi:hypothetical protein
MYTLAPHRNTSQPFVSDPSRSTPSQPYPIDNISSAAQVPRDSPYFLPDHQSYLPSPSLDIDANYSDRRDIPLTRDLYPRPRSYSEASDPSGTLGPSVAQYRARQYQVVSHATHPDDISYPSSRQNDLSNPILPSLSRRDDHATLMESSMLVPNIRYQSDPSPMAVASPSIRSSVPEPALWPALPKDSPPEPAPQRRKPRREKPRIELAPDQPPTTQGKPRARVYVACVQWYVNNVIKCRRVFLDRRLISRNRKIRCDGAKPVCHNCSHRSTGNGECTYDAAPKRRGPDKTPGARQRMARDVRNEIDGVGVPARRRRRRRDEEGTKSNSSISDRMRSQSMSDAGSQNGNLPSPLWPLSLPMVSDATQSSEAYMSPVHNFSNASPKSASEFTGSVCSTPSVYGQSFIGRHDHGDMSRQVHSSVRTPPMLVRIDA